MDTVAPIVEDLVDVSGAVAVGAASLRLDGSEIVLHDAGRAFHAASTMKVPVLVELYRRVECGDLALDDRLPIRNAFRSIADGSAYALDPADDSETSLYQREGQTASLHDLARLMTVVSSNLATNLLVDHLGASAIAATMRDLDLPGLVVLRGVEDGPAWRAGLNNTVTALDLARLLRGIARGDVVSPAASRAMEAILMEQAFNEGIPAGLPAGTVVAHKTGSISHHYHDAAIIRAAGCEPYVLVVLTEGLDETLEAPGLVAAITAATHAAASSRGR
jgi:beta-lactamase class A